MSPPHLLINPTAFLLSISLYCLHIVAQSSTPAPETAGVARYEFRISAGTWSPDCFERQVLLVNGDFGPTVPIEVNQGDILELTLINDVPASFPLVPGGLNIHWHGFSMNGVPWFDGASYVNTCPVQPGESFTYRFPVNEMPGTYFWHAHNGAAMSDGLTGPLIVRPPNSGANDDTNGAFVPPLYDGEHTLFINDWYHQISGLMVAALNRPFTGFAPEDWTADDGNFTWVGNPQSVLINGKGVFQDCTPPPTASPVGTNATCAVLDSSQSGGCKHAEIEVEAGKTYLLRLINSGALTYQTVCFEGHSVTIIAADAVPIEPLPTRCVDINLGQRYDVLLTADQTPGLYWISSQSQYRPGSPSGYAVLRYKDQPGELPSTPAPQPGSETVWGLDFEANIKLTPEFLEGDSPLKSNPVYDVATTPVPEPTSWLMINSTQPVLSETGQIRWALNNVVHAQTPPCDNLQSLITSDPAWLATSTQNTLSGATNATATELRLQQGAGTDPAVFIANLTSPTQLANNPTVGSHVAPVALGQVVEVVIQNNPANSFNGGGGNRTAQEQHPFHMHGHHFWVLGVNQGIYPGSAAAAPFLNTENPPLRDTITLAPNSYVVLRFLANNPGTWLLHCHIPFHQGMGQAMAISEGAESIPDPPSGMPTCVSPCTYSEAPWNITYTVESFGEYVPSPPPTTALVPGAASAALTTGHGLYANVVVLLVFVAALMPTYCF